MNLIFANYRLLLLKFDVELQAQTRIKYLSCEGALKLNGYIGTFKENNPIRGIIHYIDSNLLVMVATFKNNAG